MSVWGVTNTFRAVRQRGSERLISISSIGGRKGVQDKCACTFSKWAVIGPKKQAAIELGPYKVAANAIAPGPVDTPMYRSEDQITSKGLSTTAKQDAALNPMLPVGDCPPLVPVDIANAAVFLAGDAGALTSGVSLDVAPGYNAFYTS